MTLQELASWHIHYDSAKYSPQVYEELVVKGKEHPEKFNIMGAWKTGCLKKDAHGTAYTDGTGQCYAYTDRWDNHTPVGKSTWAYINANQADVEAKVPATFPVTKPDILKELQDRPGFGFIWGLFTLHCFYPEVYPLYDQHVYRAYKRFTTQDQRPYFSAPNNWQEYANYRNFFLNSIQELNMPYWLFDRALWSYGKSIKLPRMKHKKIEATNTHNSQNSCPGGFEWKKETTLGGKVRPFCWRIDENNSLHFARKFKKGTRWYWEIGAFAEEEISMIQKYMEPVRWVALANNVQKLANGTEQEGLGRFIYENIEDNTKTAQLASQVAALFCKTKIWEWNDAKTGMQFRSIPAAKWQQQLTEAYKAQNTLTSPHGSTST